MNKNRLTIALLLACLFPHVAKAIEQIKVEVTTNRTAETKISPYIYGNFIEAGFGRQVSGMWSEMIYNRGFALQGSYPRMGQTGVLHNGGCFRNQCIMPMLHFGILAMKSATGK